MAEALAEVMTEGAFINGALIGISENRRMGEEVAEAPLPNSTTSSALGAWWVLRPGALLRAAPCTHTDSWRTLEKIRAAFSKTARALW